MDLREFPSDLTDPAGRGEAYGRALSSDISRAIALYATYWRRQGIPADDVAQVAAGARRATRAWWPSAHDELEAVAAGAGVDPAAVFALNARTEVRARLRSTAGECSAVAAVGGPRPRSVQTWDWNPYLAPVGVLVRHPSPSGAVSTFTEPGMLAKIGVNAGGLGMHFNILHHASDARTTDAVPVHLVARRVLMEATTVDAAVAIARSAPLAASTVLSVVAGQEEHAEGACLELSPVGVEVVEPDEDGFLWHTNHFRSSRLAPGELVDPVTTYDRAEHLVAERAGILAATTGPELARAMCGRRGAAAPVNVRPDDGAAEHDRVATLLTVALDLASCRLRLSPGPADEFRERVW